MADAKRVSADLDASKPNAARIFNYLLGGKDNYEADQAVAERMLAVAPDTRTLAWFSRKFLVQSVELAAEAGIRQFIDIGAGIPITPSVHEVAQKIDSSARVIAIDYDPIVLAHSNALLASIPGVTPLLGDVRRPGEMLDALRAKELVDFDQPVAVLLVGVLHYVMANEGPAEIIAQLRDAMAPGSYLAFTHGSSDTTADFQNQSSGDTVGSSAQVVYRSAAEVTELFDGFELLDPGVVPIQQWLGDNLPITNLVLLGGVCRKP